MSSGGTALEDGKPAETAEHTTWPERWDVDACCADRVSKMHGCYNAVGMWFVQGLAGIDVDFARTGNNANALALVPTVPTPQSLQPMADGSGKNN